MEPHKSLMVKEAVLEGLSTLQKQSVLPKPSRTKLTMVGTAVVVALGISAAVFYFSGKGDVAVLKQRLLGQVHLTDGSYSARSVDELNQLSWENGLDIMATLDVVNQDLRRLGKTETSARLSRHEAQKTTVHLKTSLKRLDSLLDDRRTLLKTAQVFQITQLYSPVFEDYLKETQDRVTALNSSKNEHEKLVQK